MGYNGFVHAVASYGYKSEAKGTKIWRGFQARSGERIAITAYAAKHAHATVASHLYFMQVLGRTTLGSASADGVYSAVLTATVTTSNNVATSDWIAIVDDAGYTNFARVVSWTAATKTVVFDTALDSAAAAGSEFYHFGVTTDTGHIRSKSLTAGGTQVTDSKDGGLFFAAAKSDPMLVVLTNPSATSSIDYVSAIYINK